MLGGCQLNVLFPCSYFHCFLVDTRVVHKPLDLLGAFEDRQRRVLEMVMDLIGMCTTGRGVVTGALEVIILRLR